LARPLGSKNKSVPRDNLPFCGCGCGSHVANEGRKFLSGHDTRTRLFSPVKGKHWKIRMDCNKKIMGLSDDHKAKIGLSGIGRFVSEETRLKKSKSFKGNNNPMYGKPGTFLGKHHTQESKDKISNNKERSIKISRALKGSKRPWAMENIKKMLQTIPNKTELRLFDLINKVCPDQYLFTGDGTFQIGRLFPDFVNHCGQNKVIEMFGNHWHTKDEEQKRIEIFSKLGYKCLIIWESELSKISNHKNVLDKITKFNSEALIK
jgi:very-short-patch-repair endonuclease